METRDLPQHPHHSFYQPLAPDGQKHVSGAAPVPALPRSGQGRRRDTAPSPGYQVVKDEIKRILIGVVSQLVNPKWWLYGLFEELGASKAFLKKFKGMSDREIRTALLRSQLTRSKRFAILKRDNYTCRYCHRTGVPLEVEHVVALYNGGTNDDSNLVAACHDCNQGKGIQDA
jgi:HNH endonuclease